jgi:putative hydrolase of the HAD superfamily
MAARERIRREPDLGSPERLFAREVELVGPSFGLTPEEAARRLTELRALLPAALTLGVEPYPGVRGALEAAHARGLSLAVLSDYAPQEKLRHLGLDDLPWAAAIGGESLGVLKPGRRAFHQLAERLGLEPGAIVHLGDREDLDVDGALEAGFRAWRFSRRPGSTRAERAFDRWTLGLFAPLFEEI